MSLAELTKKYVQNKIEWTKTHQKAFDALKNCLSNATNCMWWQTVWHFVDASNTAVGSCLIQVVCWRFRETYCFC